MKSTNWLIVQYTGPFLDGTKGIEVADLPEIVQEATVLIKTPGTYYILGSIGEVLQVQEIKVPGEYVFQRPGWVRTR